jgi:hypothetical protein
VAITRSNSLAASSLIRCEISSPCGKERAARREVVLKVDDEQRATGHRQR